MPTHKIGYSFADDSGTLPISATPYIVDGEVNLNLPIPAGAANLEFDIGWLRAKTNDYFLAVGSQTAAQLATGGVSEATAGQLIVNVNSANFNGLAAPAAPVPTTAATGGTVAAGVYPVVVTYVNAQGETVGSAAGTVTTTGTTSTITVPSPASVSGATGWYAYVGQAGSQASTATRQQAAGSPTAIGTALTLSAPPTNTGAAIPVVNTTGTNPQIVLTAKSHLAYAPCIAGSQNLFTTDVSKLFVTNPGTTALILIVRVGLNL